MKKRHSKIGIMLMVILAFSANGVAQGDSSVVWKKNFGGGKYDYFYSVTAVTDGIVAVGCSFIGTGVSGDWRGSGDWTGFTGNGGEDAIIVKFDNDGKVVWQKNFGGMHSDRFYSVTAMSDGVVAVGYAHVNQYSGGDWKGFSGTSGTYAIVVKFDNNGNVVWKKIFEKSEGFSSVIAVSDSIIAVGNYFIVKYDYNGDVVWQKKYLYNNYNSVIAVSDGIIAVGDYFIAKYDHNGDTIWQKDLSVGFSAVTTTSDGIIAVGGGENSFFDNGDWAGVKGKGKGDAIIVKYDFNGEVVWKKNFGGDDDDEYSSVMVVQDGIIAVGSSFGGSFGTGDWAGIKEKDNWNGEWRTNIDAIIVKYDFNGEVLWKKNFGGKDDDYYLSVTALLDGIIAVGYARLDGGDWEDVLRKGNWYDAIVVKYDTSLMSFVPITNITDVPATAVIGTPLTLTGTVMPNNATNQNIVWSIKDADTTGANIKKNILNTAASGTVIVTASVANGLAIGTDFTKDFTIQVNTVGIAGIAFPTITVFPNPTRNQLRITNYELPIKQVELYSIVGNLIQTIQVDDYEAEINMQNLQSGVYYVKITTENDVVTRKIIKY